MINPTLEGTGNVPQQAFVQYNDPHGNKLIALNRDGTIFSTSGMLVPASGNPTEVDMISGNTVPIVHGAVALLNQNQPLIINGESEDESLMHLISIYMDSHLDGGGAPGDNTLRVYLTWTDPSGKKTNVILGVLDGVDTNSEYISTTIAILPKISTPIIVTTVYDGVVANKNFTYDISVCKMHLPLDGYVDQFVVTTNTGGEPIPVATETFVLGDLVSLPSYSFWEGNGWLTTASDKISLQVTYPDNESALQVAIDGGPSTTSVQGVNCLVNGYNSVYALNFKCSIQGAGGYAAGIIGNATTKDSSATHSNLIGGYFVVGSSFAGGQADYVAGVQVTSFGDTTGVVAAYGLDVNLVCADLSSGTAAGIWIEPDSSYTGIQGNTRFAIKSDTLAPSVFAGSLSATTLVEATTLTPSSAASAGVTGQIAWDSGFIYVCTAGGAATHATWKKAALTAT
jgi:hypothetical protein